MKHSKKSSLVPKRRVNLVIMALVVFAVAAAGYWLVRYGLAASATLALTPPSQSVPQNTELAVAVRLNTGGTNVNVVQANLAYPADKLQFVTIDSSNSAFNGTAEASAANGSVHIGRYVSGAHGNMSGDILVATVYFKALTGSGSAAITFTDGSAAYNSTNSANVLVGKTGGLYGFQPAGTPVSAATVPPAPDPTTIDSSSLVASPAPRSTGLLTSTAVLVVTWLLFLAAVLYGLYRLYRLLRPPVNGLAVTAAIQPQVVYPTAAIVEPTVNPAVTATEQTVAVTASSPLPEAKVTLQPRAYLKPPVTVAVMIGLSTLGVILVTAGRAANRAPATCRPNNVRVTTSNQNLKPCPQAR